MALLDLQVDFTSMTDGVIRLHLGKKSHNVRLWRSIWTELPLTVPPIVA
jgi:hypothetical protein